MSSKQVFKNNINTELTINHTDDSQSLEIGTEELRALKALNFQNLTNGTLPTVDPVVAGQLWSNSNVVTVSTGT